MTPPENAARFLWRWNRIAIGRGWPIFGLGSRGGGTTWLVIGRLPGRPRWKTWRVLPLPWAHVSLDACDEDDEAMRAVVSRQWAEDWNSPEDAIYDD